MVRNSLIPNKIDFSLSSCLYSYMYLATNNTLSWSSKQFLALVAAITILAINLPNTVESISNESEC